MRSSGNSNRLYFPAKKSWRTQVIGWSFIVLMMGTAHLLSAPERLYGVALVSAPLATLGLGLLTLSTVAFAVRGYTITRDTLIVQRLFWETSISLVGFERIEPMPGGRLWSVRLFGNGGVFAVSGYYWNQTLGRHRVLATDFYQGLVLYFRGEQPLVVTPADEKAFAAALHELTGRGRAPGTVI